MKSLHGLGLGLLLCVCTVLAAAESGAGSPKLDIAPGPLGQALTEFAKQSGLQVILDAQLAEGVQSPGVRGTLSAEAALERLLAQTPFRAEWLDGHTVAIRAVNAGETAWAAGDGKGWEGVRRLAQAQGDSTVYGAVGVGDGVEGKQGHSETAEDAKGINLEEIIVTAQRREERLLDTPISIGVLSGAELDEGMSRSVADVLNQVGGVSIIQDSPGTVRIAIRGILSGSAAAGSASAYYIDEAPFSLMNNANLPDTNAYDLARVEVLRGPQGTLYGANALAGVVRVITNNANVDEFEASGRFRGSATEDAGDNFSTDAMVNVPIMEGVLALRGVVGYSDQSGYITVANNCFTVGCTPGTEEINSTEAQSYRLRAAFTPTDALSIDLSYMRSEIDNATLSNANANFQTQFSENRPQNIAYDMYGLSVSYDFGNFTLLSSTGYIDYFSHARVELTPIIPALVDDGLTSTTQEFRLSSNLDGPWQWSAGAYYRDATESINQDPQAVITGNLVADYHSESYAVFSELSRFFSDGRYELTGGLRYFTDDFEATQYSSFFNGNLFTQADTFEHVTWRALFAYRPNDETMLYSSAATGFRSGRNQSFSALSFNPTLPTVRPDDLITYEVGAKGRIFDRRLTYDTAIYYTEWNDIQQTLTIPQGFPGYLNAGTASGPGVDLSLTFEATESLSLRGSLGWNDLRYDENVYQGTANDILFESGARLNESPEWTGSVGFDYQQPTSWPDVDFVASGTATYTSEVLARSLAGTPAVATIAHSDAVTKLDLRVGLEGPHWAINLFGDNLTNEDGFMTPNVTNGEGLHYRPRTIGIQLSANY